MHLDQRVPEPELMEEPEQARAYSEADFASAHDAVVEHLLMRWPQATSLVGSGVDLGCGPADVTARIASALPSARLVGLDAGPRMLALGRARLRRVGLEGRVELRHVRLPAGAAELEELGRYDLVTSNSLLHHLGDPTVLWEAVVALGAPGAVVHVVDLRRPRDDEQVDRLVAVHAEGEPQVLVDDFRNSLRAAYRPSEVAGQVREAGLDGVLTVEEISDRHLLVHGRLP